MIRISGGASSPLITADQINNRMAFTWLTGNLDEELAKAGVHR